MSNFNRINVKIQPSGNVRLVIERRHADGGCGERITVSVSRREFERALSAASIEVPWQDVKASIR
jgi:hypothetical protein